MSFRAQGLLLSGLAKGLNAVTEIDGFYACGAQTQVPAQLIVQVAMNAYGLPAHERARWSRLLGSLPKQCGAGFDCMDERMNLANWT